MSGLSYARNNDKFSFVYDTIASRVQQWANVQPQKTAVVVYMPDGERKSITFGELLQKSKTLAKYFVSIGVKKGDMVAVFVYNSTEWLIAVTACSLVGAVSFNSYTFSSEKDVDVLQKLNAKVLLIDLRDIELRSSWVTRLRNIENTELNVVVLGEKVNGCWKTFEEVLSMEFKENLSTQLDPEATSIIFQTSGSTGVPKFVPFSDMGVLNNLCGVYARMEMDGNDIFFSDRPMGYMAGFPCAIFILGCTFVTLDTRHTVRDSHVEMLFNILKKEYVTTGYLAAYLVSDLEILQKSSQENLQKFKSLIMSGQRASKNLLDRFKKYSAIPCIGYGASEVGWSNFTRLTDISDIKDDILGAPLPMVEIKVIDEHGQPVPLNADGEICIRNGTTTNYYLTIDGEEHRVTDDSGWFHTGDIGFLSDEDQLYIKGRKVEIIKRSLIKIFPASIESVISKHPSVAEVVVVGVPDERTYQEVCACVKVKEGRQLSEAQLEAYAVDQFKPEMAPDGKGHMPGYCLILDKFPLLPTLKVDRKGVANLAASLVSKI